MLNCFVFVCCDRSHLIPGASHVMMVIGSHQCHHLFREGDNMPWAQISQLMFPPNNFYQRSTSTLRKQDQKRRYTWILPHPQFAIFGDKQTWCDTHACVHYIPVLYLSCWLFAQHVSVHEGWMARGSCMDLIDIWSLPLSRQHPSRPWCRRHGLAWQPLTKGVAFPAACCHGARYDGGKMSRSHNSILPWLYP